MREMGIKAPGNTEGAKRFEVEEALAKEGVRASQAAATERLKRRHAEQKGVPEPSVQEPVTESHSHVKEIQRRKRVWERYKDMGKKSPGGKPTVQ